MKYLELVLMASICFVFVSCSKDSETEESSNLPGTYELSMARDECPDSANNGSINATSDGVCINLSNGSECYKMTLQLNPDMTYTFTQITTTITGGIMNSRNASEAGNYNVTGNRVTTTDIGGLVTVYNLDDTGNHLDWIATTTDLGCDRIFRFSK